MSRGSLALCAAFVATATLFAVSDAVAAPVRYHVIALDPGSGDTNYGGPGINKKGLVAGYDGEARTQRAMLFHRGKKSTELGTLGGAWSIALAVNDTGVVVGQSENSQHQSHAFSWSQGVMTDLGQLPTTGTANVSVARAINSSGQIVGASAIDNWYSHAFLYQAGVMTDLGALPGGIQSYAFGINDLGHVVGETMFQDGSTRALVYRDGAMVELGALGGAGGSSSAQAINAQDRIAGWARRDASSAAHAVVWHDGTVDDLGALPGSSGSASWAHGLNDKGIVVGEATTDPANTVYAAFVHNGRKMFDLNALLDADSAGWVLTSATGINNAGEITGFGTFGGVTQMFLATPVN